MTYLPIGEISHGTLRNQDLASAMLPLLQAVGADKSLVADIDNIASMDDMDDPSPYESSEAVNEAMDALDEHAPPYCYFGFHEGDGSSLGVWPNIEWMDEDSRYGELLKVSDLADLDGKPEYDGLVMLVNDHGNVTLYSATSTPAGTNIVEEIWSIV